MEIQDQQHNAENRFPTCLPFEIVTKIFMDCLYSDRLEGPQPDVDIAPLLLCRVCRLWRDIAKAIPQLWTDLYIRFPSTSSNHPNDDSDLIMSHEELAFIDRWANNSKPIPPSFRIHFTNFQIWRNQTNFAILEDFLASSSIRSSRALELQFVDKGQGLRAVTSSQAPFQNLEYFMMVRSHEYHAFFPSLKFPPAPSLRRMLLDCRLSIKDISLTFPLVQLTHLCLMRDIGVVEWPDLLSHCVNLKYACFRLSITSTPLNKRLVLHNMRQMTLECDFLSLITFKTFLFPEMQSLRLAKPSLVTSSPHSNCILTTDELHRILGSFPALTELHIQLYVKAPDSTDESNQFQRHLSTCVPKLEVLMIDQIKIVPNSQDIIQFLRSNWLRSGWSSTSRVRVEIVVIIHSIFDRLFGTAKEIRDHLDSLNDDQDTIEVVLREEKEAHWEYAHITNKDLRDNWLETMKFYH